MQCERLLKLSKSWYLHVRDETMAPARMIAFMEKHADECPICQVDPDLQDEIAKITELILPESKIPKAVRLQQEQEEAEAEAEEQDDEHEEDGEHDDDEDDDMLDDEDMNQELGDDLI